MGTMCTTLMTRRHCLRHSVCLIPKAVATLIQTLCTSIFRQGVARLQMAFGRGKCRTFWSMPRTRRVLIPAGSTMKTMLQSSMLILKNTWSIYTRMLVDLEDLGVVASLEVHD